MSHPQLDNLVHIGQLKAEPPSKEECDGLLNSAICYLRDARLEVLSLESRFDLVYNASHALALVALRLLGYRPKSRNLVFQCLQHTATDLSNEDRLFLERAHSKRNHVVYEGEMCVDEMLVSEMTRIVKNIRLLLNNFRPEKGLIMDENC
ncbi:MAG: hypothetical protein H6965_10115 [Chromatiaceae bacterium]|nr:hypothetical protein [Chromatiaceae bacterium]